MVLKSKNNIKPEEFDHTKFELRRSPYWLRIRKKANNLLGRPSALAVILCYNDSDILEDVINYLLDNKHQIIVWDHGSDDDTSKILDRYDSRLLERQFVPRSFDFYKLYPTMSQHLIDYYIDKFDWISWPDQDEILEGPSRKKNYYHYITKVYGSRYNWIQFHNFNYWFTEKDDKTIQSPIKRVRYYSIFPNCAPRIRSWRASVTNIREFNHNPLPGDKYPDLFHLRHYPMRSQKQMRRRLNKDRASIQRGKMNVHYNNMHKTLKEYRIQGTDLHFDDGTELNHDPIYDWDVIYFGNAKNKH